MKISHSLKNRSSLAFPALVLIFVLAGFFQMNLQETIKIWETSLTRSLQIQALKVGRTLEAQFFERYMDAQAFSLNSAIRRSVGKPSADTAQVTDILTHYVELYRIYPLTLVADARGRIIAVNDRSASGERLATARLIGRDVSGEAWFKGAMAGGNGSAAKRLQGSFVENLRMDDLVALAYGSARITQSFSAPILSPDGRVAGVISNRADVAYIQQEFRDAHLDLEAAGLPNAGLYLLSETGETLARHTHGSSAQADSMSAVIPVNGPKILDSLGWKLRLAAPRSELFHGVSDLKRNAYLVAICLFLIAVLSIAAFFALYWLSVQRQVRNERELSRRILAAQEEERARIAQEVHDELGQNLSVMKLEVSKLKKASEIEFDRRLDSLRFLLSESTDTVRRVSSELRPSILDTMGLQAALSWQQALFSERTGIKATLSYQLDERLVDREFSISIYRVIQEALTNVIRHAKATQVLITIGNYGSQVELVITDDGVGFPGMKSLQPGSLGVFGMQERAKSLGGRFVIERGPGGIGTRIHLQIERKPLDGQASAHC